MVRRSGILLHISSLPDRYGIGNLGEPAHKFAEFLQASGQSLWQVLPVGPPGYGNSPYSSLSAFAGNPLFINLERLVEEGYLKTEDLITTQTFPTNKIDYQAVADFKIPLLKKAATQFVNTASPAEKAQFELFCQENREWLVPYAIFMSLKETYGQKAWYTWNREVRLLNQSDLTAWVNRYKTSVHQHFFLQYIFFKQWEQMKDFCNNRGIMLMGDLPIFVALDSAEVWAHQEIFDLDENGRPNTVAGVPPDYFSQTGQLWGNPLYRWNIIRDQGYSWWIKRMRMAFRLFDIVRLDHFRGFESFWAIPANARTAKEGQWNPGPGAELFTTLKKELGPLPVIAEDLGIITPEVEVLRDMFNFPGMRVLQFAWDKDPGKNIHLPHFHIKNCVVYTGTHDNTTTCGWFRGEDIEYTTQNKSERQEQTKRALKYLGTDGREINWDFIRLAFSSVADTAIIPLQDVLGLGNESRMNTPGTTFGNWEWRLEPGELTDEITEHLRELTWLTGRLKDGQPAQGH